MQALIDHKEIHVRLPREIVEALEARITKPNRLLRHMVTEACRSYLDREAAIAAIFGLTQTAPDGAEEGK